MKLFKKAGKTILKISRVEWIDMGKKWLKFASSYKSKRGIVFTEGASLNLGSAGRVKIVKIDLVDKIATLQGENEKTLLIDMDTLDLIENIEDYKAKKIEKAREEAVTRTQRYDRTRETEERREQARRRMNQLFTIEDRGFYLMGFIAANGVLSAQIPSHEVEKYEAMYKKIKGQPPSPGSYEIARSESKWASQLRIHLPKSRVQGEIKSLFVNTFGFELKETQSNYDINATVYVKKLLELGFDIGQNSQNVDVIAQNIEDRYGTESRSQFESGFLHI